MVEELEVISEGVAVGHCGCGRDHRGSGQELRDQSWFEWIRYLEYVWDECCMESNIVEKRGCMGEVTMVDGIARMGGTGYH